jgi:quercetin dioxygenase-like cupin family protein
MNTRKICIAIALLAFSATAAAQHHGHTLLKPDELKWTDVPSLPAGAKIAVVEGPMNKATPFTVRLKFPANYRIPPHSHPAVERVTVLSGTFHLGTGEKFDKGNMAVLPAGGITIMPSGMTHYVWIPEETTVQLHGTGPWGIQYVNPADDPRQ